MSESCQTIDAGLFHLESLRAQLNRVGLNPPHWWVKTRIVWQGMQAQTYRAGDFLMRESFELLKQHASDVSIERLDVSVRVFNALRNANIPTIGAVLDLSERELMRIRNLGRRSYNDLLFSLDDLAEQLKNHGPRILNLKYCYLDLEQSFIYLLEWDGCYKIGVSTNVEARIVGLNTLPSPHEIKLVHKVKVFRCFAINIESNLHSRFKQYRIEHKHVREWFRLPQDVIDWFCSLRDGDLDE